MCVLSLLLISYAGAPDSSYFPQADYYTVRQVYYEHKPYSVDRHYVDSAEINNSSTITFRSFGPNDDNVIVHQVSNGFHSIIADKQRDGFVDISSIANGSRVLDESSNNYFLATDSIGEAIFRWDGSSLSAIRRFDNALLNPAEVSVNSYGDIIVGAREPSRRMQLYVDTPGGWQKITATPGETRPPYFGAQIRDNGQVIFQGEGHLDDVRVVEPGATNSYQLFEAIDTGFSADVFGMAATRSGPIRVVVKEHPGDSVTLNRLRYFDAGSVRTISIPSDAQYFSAALNNRGDIAISTARGLYLNEVFAPPIAGNGEVLNGHYVRRPSVRSGSFNDHDQIIFRAMTYADATASQIEGAMIALATRPTVQHVNLAQADGTRAAADLIVFGQAMNLRIPISLTGNTAFTIERVRDRPIEQIDSLLMDRSVFEIGDLSNIIDLGTLGTVEFDLQGAVICVQSDDRMFVNQQDGSFLSDGLIFEFLSGDLYLTASGPISNVLTVSHIDLSNTSPLAGVPDLVGSTQWLATESPHRFEASVDLPFVVRPQLMFGNDSLVIEIDGRLIASTQIAIPEMSPWALGWCAVSVRLFYRSLIRRRHQA